MLEQLEAPTQTTQKRYACTVKSKSPMIIDIDTYHLPLPTVLVVSPLLFPTIRH